MDTLRKEIINHFTEDSDSKWPSGLQNAAKIAEQLRIPAEKILELANAHYIPHWRLDNGEPLFQIGEVKKWAAKNLLNRIEGQDYPINLRIMVMPPAPISAPLEIREIPDLRQIPLHECPSGIYFLVDNNKVVYIGQSVNPLMRISEHRKDKKFTQAYMIPVPKSLLDAVEGALIRAMNPPLNSGAREVATGPGNCDKDQAVLAKFAHGLGIITTQ